MSGRVAGAFFLALAQALAARAQAGALGTSPVIAGTMARATWNSTGAERAPFLFPSDWVGRPAASRPVRTWEKHKSGRVAMVSSFVVPGLGQLYNEREFWALVAAGVEVYFASSIVVEQRLEGRYQTRARRDDIDKRRACALDPNSQACADATLDFRFDTALFVLHRDNRIQSTWLLGLSALLSGLQAFVDAHLFDFDTSPPPPVRFEPARLPDGPGAALRLHF